MKKYLVVLLAMILLVCCASCGTPEPGPASSAEPEVSSSTEPETTPSEKPKKSPAAKPKTTPSPKPEATLPPNEPPIAPKNNQETNTNENNNTNEAIPAAGAQEYVALSGSTIFTIPMPETWAGKYRTESADGSIRVYEKQNYEDDIDWTDGWLYEVSIRQDGEIYGHDQVVAKFYFEGTAYDLIFTRVSDIRYDIENAAKADAYLTLLNSMYEPVNNGYFSGEVAVTERNTVVNPF